jgi:hypothetical protein
MHSRSIEELQLIVLAGGGLKISMRSRGAEQLRLLALAAASSGKRPLLIFYDLAGKSSEELGLIASAGDGCVMFCD